MNQDYKIRDGMLLISDVHVLIIRVKIVVSSSSTVHFTAKCSTSCMTSVPQTRRRSARPRGEHVAGLAPLPCVSHSKTKNRTRCTAAPATYTYGTPYITARSYQLKRLAVSQQSVSVNARRAGIRHRQKGTRRSRHAYV
jgi:hypothetical protein